MITGCVYEIARAQKLGYLPVLIRLPMLKGLDNSQCLSDCWRPKVWIPTVLIREAEVKSLDSSQCVSDCHSSKAWIAPGVDQIDQAQRL